jgi:putative intracellular protease/amidase
MMTNRLLYPRPSLLQRAGRGLLRQAGLHPHDRDVSPPQFAGATALCIATSHGALDVGVATGVFASELTVPYYRFLDAGLTVDVASIKGGIVPVDPLSMKPALRTEGDDRMLADELLRSKLMFSLPVADTEFTKYDLIYLAGGWGAAFDFGQSDTLARKIGEAAAAGRILGGICHGPLGLLHARLPDGSPLVRGRRLTAVTDRQVRQLGISITPLHPESALRAAGAAFESRSNAVADFFANHYVADGDLVTGQNQNAGPMVARLMLERLQTKRTGVLS